jgi:hypothetical protein
MKQEKNIPKPSRYFLRLINHYTSEPWGFNSNAANQIDVTNPQVFVDEPGDSFEAVTAASTLSRLAASDPNRSAEGPAAYPNKRH